MGVPIEAIFHFQDHEAPQVQDDGICKALFEDFWTKVLNCDSRLYRHEMDLNQIRKPFVTLHWRARYASVILVTKVNPVMSSMVVVGLDGWKYVVHSSMHGRERTAIPDVCSPSIFEMGPYPAEKVNKLLEEMDKSLAASEQANRAGLRGQSSDHQGNQKTPSFVATILQQVMENSKAPLPIQGGTTDVSLHTGCIPRNTSFPLVLTTFRTMLRRQGGCMDDQIFFKCVTVYFMNHLVHSASQLDSFVPDKIDRSVCIIREIESYLEKIEDEAFIAAIVQELKIIHQKILDLRPGAKVPSSSETLYYDPDAVPDICKTLRAPSLPEVKAPRCIQDHESKMAQARLHAEMNLQWSDLQSREFTGKIQHSWVQISSFNRFFWSIALQLDNDEMQCNIKDLRSKLDIFSQHIGLAATISLKSTLIMSVVLRSYELLASWICYCCAHRALEQMHSFFRNYGSALDPDDLVHLVLDQNEAREALGFVRAFLRARRQRLRPFSSDETATLALASEYGRLSSVFQTLHKKELEAVNLRIDQRWTRIQEDQAKLCSLDMQQWSAEQNLARAKSEYETSKQRDYTWDSYYPRRRIYNSHYYETKNKLQRCEEKVDSLKREITQLEQKPANIVMGLPENIHESLKWLFFLYMPDEFQNLSALAHIGQSKLWEKSPSSEILPLNLQQWYLSHRKCATNNTCSSAMELASISRAMDFHVGAVNIRSYQRRTGVFTPDSYLINPTWKNGNPFAHGRTYEHTASLFTELLPNTDQQKFIQQFLCFIPSKTRENMGIACRDSKPNWLSFEQFAMFVKMRSGKVTQVRHLVTALQDNLLPFSHECVLILLKQLIFHVGQEDWWGDLMPPMFGYDLIAKQLVYRVELLRESPKSSADLLLFGILSSYFGQVDKQCRVCAREFSSIARSWAKSVDSEAGQVENVPKGLYWKQAKFFGYALLCRSFDFLSSEELLEVVELLVLYRQKFLFASQDSQTQSKSLDDPIAQVVSSKLTEILDVIRKDLNCLTKIISLVLDNVPSDLQWSPVAFRAVRDTACFEAAADQLYSINLLNGTVLVDGVPPGFLPTSVVDDPQYRRIFGSRNFEVVVMGSQHFRSSRLIDGRLTYEFLLDSDNTLHILEHDKGTANNPQQKLQLLVRNGFDLPTILREDYSHWYYEVGNAVVLRKPSYCDRNIAFIITRSATYHVPEEFQEPFAESVLSKLHLCRRLLRGETKLFKLLRYFEFPEFIQIETDAEQETLWHILPRCQLSFVQTKHNVLLEQFQDFYLQSPEVVNDTIPGLNRVLSITNSCGEEKIIIAHGVVGPNAQISIPTEWKCQISFHVYEVHKRFRHFTAADTTGRLHLAALYASSSCLLADRRVGKLGTTVAVDLVRKCWKNEPLKNTEQLKLIEVSAFSWRSCTLRLMCTWIWKSSNSVHFLYKVDDPPRNDKLDPDMLAQDEYRQSDFCQPLLACEEHSLLGFSRPCRSHATPPTRSVTTRNMLFVQEMEIQMRDKYVIESICQKQKEFPLSRPPHCIGLERELYETTKESYQTHCKIPLKSIGMVNEVELRAIEEECRQRRENVEFLILHAVNEENQLPLHRLKFISGRIERATSLDLLQLLFDSATISSFDPDLTRDKMESLHLDIIDWAVLCVFEDKMRRLVEAIINDDDAALVQEFCCLREWHPASHLRWLAFEVEQQLQIRPNQHDVFRQLQANPCSVIQLIMGAGKTRVLVPMLILDLLGVQKTARVNILPSIVREAVDFFRNCLVSSIQHVKLFCLPFDRSILLDKHRALQMSTEFESCCLQQGMLVMTPQHRNSLLLKEHDHDLVVETNDEAFVDVFDESDAILSHDFQLVYALGQQQPLPAGVSRWKVLHALLQTLARDTSEEMHSITKDRNLMHRESDKLGAFPNIRILLPFHGKELQFGSCWCKALIMNPPYDLQWMKDVPANDYEILIKLMSDPTTMNVMECIHKNPLFRENASDILSCRGFIAFGILFHGLESRYRVNYGLNSASNTVMAVPYSACDTPKIRAQYSHPDMELVYTALSYLSKGLTEAQMKHALVLLQTLGPVAQRMIYREWIEAVRIDVIPEKLILFDDIIKVDVDNVPLMRSIHRHLGKCMEAIYFWATSFVYNVGTYRFPKRRATSAWNLVESSCSWGFSGTDDNKFLIPLSVKQLVPDEEGLRATNGAMIRTIIDRVEKITLLTSSRGEENLTWKMVLNRCISMSVNALIDVAGLMAGCSNSRAAEYLADTGSFAGVVYFDDEWKVFDSKKKHSVSLVTSPLSEADCFVYFDESRCRGSDMKLKRTAKALVTVEPKLTKDKFLQGCMRMRKLRQGGQSLILAGTAEMISPESTAKNLMEKIFRNTVTTTKKGIPIYFRHGLNFFLFPTPIEDEVSLESMYGRHVPCYTDFDDYLDATLQLSEVSLEEAGDLVEHCKTMGKGTVTAMRGDFTEECEQELEEEVEEEEQMEIESPSEEPNIQVDWDFNKAFSDPDSLFKNYFLSVATSLNRDVPCLSALEWSEKIFCTPNFWNTTKRGQGSGLSLYLRPVDTILAIPDGRIALLSFYDLEKLLPVWWDTKTPKATLRHLSLAESGRGFGKEIHVFDDEVLATVKLFRGYVQYTETQRKFLASKLKKIDEALLFVLQLLQVRDRQSFLERSDLHEITLRLHAGERIDNNSVN